MSNYDAYLVTWNPARKPWLELPRLAQQTANGMLADEWWNVSNTGIMRGDRIYLLKQGREPLGIMGSGWARSSSEKTRPHWDDVRQAGGEEVHFIEIDWDTLLDPMSEPLLAEAEISTPEPPERLWNARNSGNRIRDDVVARLEDLWKNHIATVRGFQPADAEQIESDEKTFPEGRELWQLHRSHERHPNLTDAAKHAALARGEKLICCVCKFDFHARYGDIGEGYIECHHTVPVCELAEGSRTFLSDIVLVCSNCHRMLHRRRPWLTINQLANLLVD